MDPVSSSDSSPGGADERPTPAPPAELEAELEAELGDEPTSESAVRWEFAPEEIAEIEELDLDAEEARLAELFADPRFARQAAERGQLPVARRGANGSIGRALALGFANVFDPDRKKDEVQAIQERGDDDPDGPSLDLDRDDPKSSRITFRRGK